MGDSQPPENFPPLVPLYPARNASRTHEVSSLWDLISVSSYSFPLSLCFLLFALVAAFNATRIIIHRHKLASFQFFFILLALLWFLIRWVFFFFIRIWDTYMWVGLSLYWIPVTLQFSTFLLLVTFLASVVHRPSWENGTKKIAWTVFGAANVVMSGIAVGLLVLGWEQMNLQPLNAPRVPFWIDTARSAYIATVFSILMAVLGYYSYEVHQLMADRPIPSLRVSRPRFTTSLVLIIFIFATRFVYSVIVVAENQLALELAPNTWLNEIIICAAMFLWEIVPTGVILFLFWEIRTVAPPPPVAPYVQNIEIQDPVDPLLAPNNNGSGLISSRIFSNPARYDSDDEGTPKTPSASFLSSNSPRAPSGFGSVSLSGSYKSTFSPYSTDSPLNKQPVDGPFKRSHNRKMSTPSTSINQ